MVQILILNFSELLHELNVPTEHKVLIFVQSRLMMDAISELVLKYGNNQPTNFKKELISYAMLSIFCLFRIYFHLRCFHAFVLVAMHTLCKLVLISTQSQRQLISLRYHSRYGYAFRRYDGSMTQKQRAEAVADFSSYFLRFSFPFLCCCHLFCSLQMYLVQIKFQLYYCSLSLSVSTHFFHLSSPFLPQTHKTNESHFSHFVVMCSSHAASVRSACCC